MIEYTGAPLSFWNSFWNDPCCYTGCAYGFQKIFSRSVMGQIEFNEVAERVCCWEISSVIRKMSGRSLFVQGKGQKVVGISNSIHNKCIWININWYVSCSYQLISIHVLLTVGKEWCWATLYRNKTGLCRLIYGSSQPCWLVVYSRYCSLL